MRALRSAITAAKRAIFGAALLAAGLGGLLAAGFGSLSCDSVDAAFDCQDVCSRYRDCYDANYDVGACRNRCRTNSANDSTVRGKADVCQSCIGDKSCLSATFSCGSDCSAIVP